MDGILEQILTELKEIKQILLTNEGLNTNNDPCETYYHLMKRKDAAEYLGIPEHRIETLARQRELRRIMLGGRSYYERENLDYWLNKQRGISEVMEV